MIRDHERARLAFSHVREVRDGWEGGTRARYRTICLKLPALVHTQGLTPALHFLSARGDAGQRAILPHLCQQLVAAGLVDEPAGVDPATHLLARVRDARLADLQALTRETQRVLTWYKRFVQAELRETDAGAAAAPDEGVAGGPS